MNAMMLLPIHILAGALAVLAGAVALVAAKGARTHRAGGWIFVYAMLVLAGTAAMMSFVGENNVGNILQAMLIAYLTSTAILAVSREPRSRRIDIAAMLVALTIAGTHATFAVMASRSESGAIGGYTPPMFIVFGSIALIAGVGDARMLAAGVLRGSRRVARHLWRMCFALFIATASFFLGQADEIPEALRIWPVLFVLGFAPLLTMFYWLWRVRVRGNLSRIVGVGAAGATRIDAGAAPVHAMPLGITPRIRETTS